MYNPKPGGGYMFICFDNLMFRDMLNQIHYILSLLLWLYDIYARYFIPFMTRLINRTDLVCSRILIVLAHSNNRHANPLKHISLT